MSPLSRLSAVRAFSSSVARRDLVQQLYVKELQAYKRPVVAKDAHVGNVKVFSAPTPPKAPVLPIDLASELATYDASEPTKLELEVKPSGLSEQADGGAEAFLAFLEADVQPVEAHH